jgi:hypothetical protein
MNTCLGSRTPDGFGYRELIIGPLPKPARVARTSAFVLAILVRTKPAIRNSTTGSWPLDIRTLMWGLATLLGFRADETGANNNLR